MIKKNKSNVNTHINKILNIIIGYVKTIFISIGVALLITCALTIHARSEMIKNLYVKDSERHKIDEQIAKQLVAQSDYMPDLEKNKYSICLQVGNLYETAGNYENAKRAYELAILKAKNGIYTPYYKLASILIKQGKFDEAKEIVSSIQDINDKKLIKFKTRINIEMGDKYYSIGKFISASKCYEQARYYYDKFVKRDSEVDKSITSRLVNSYVETADTIVKGGYNSDAAKFLSKALALEPNNDSIRYKLAVIYADLDPTEAVSLFEPLVTSMPQYIDYDIYNKAIVKAANIAELEGKSTEAKYLRYKLHTKDLFLKQKVVYKNDVEIICKSFSIKKFMFQYHLTGNYVIKNVSSSNINKLYADFVLKQNGKDREIVTVECSNKKHPIISNAGLSDEIQVKFGKNIFTKKELEQYTIDIYLYKDKKFKTLIGTYTIPEKSF